jgi:hypothetical protein
MAALAGGFGGARRGGAWGGEAAEEGVDDAAGFDGVGAGTEGGGEDVEGVLAAEVVAVGAVEREVGGDIRAGEPGVDGKDGAADLAGDGRGVFAQGEEAGEEASSSMEREGRAGGKAWE